MMWCVHILVSRVMLMHSSWFVSISFYYTSLSFRVIRDKYAVEVILYYCIRVCWFALRLPLLLFLSTIKESFLLSLSFILLFFFFTWVYFTLWLQIHPTMDRAACVRCWDHFFTLLRMALRWEDKYSPSNAVSLGRRIWRSGNRNESLGRTSSCMA